jgi:hypothetical protein
MTSYHDLMMPHDKSRRPRATGFRSSELITILPVNPTTIYTYWEVDSWKVEIVEDIMQKDWVDIPTVLRVFDVTDHIFDGDHYNRHVDIPVTHGTDSWYITGLEPERDYVVDFGYGISQGEFFSLVRSNCVRTPRPHRHAATYPVIRFATPSSQGQTWESQFTGYSLHIGDKP